MRKRSNAAKVRNAGKVSRLYRYMRGPLRKLVYHRLRILQFDAHLYRMLHLAAELVTPHWTTELDAPPGDWASVLSEEGAFNLGIQ